MVKHLPLILPLSKLLEDRALPNRHATLNLLEIPTAKLKGLRAVAGAHSDRNGRRLCRYKTQAMLNEDLMCAVIEPSLIDEFSQHLLRHRQVGGVIDARNGLPILNSPHGSQKAYLSAFAGFKGWRSVRDWISG